jgi:transcriptional regulator with XRE-family HTH domain
MNRNGLLQHMEHWRIKLGSYAKVARKCAISEASISTILAGKYGADEEKMLNKIAIALNYRENSWKIARNIGNYRTLEKLYQDAKEESMWFAVSNKAGSGKTATMEDLYNQDTSGSVVFIQAEEWAGRQFMMQLIRKTVGEHSLKGAYKSLSQLLDIVVGYFNDMSYERPVLLIDEADKLKAGALRTLIPLFNRTEDRLGLILSGTENLEKEIKNGVRLRKKGFDELDSRLGRNFLSLRGATQNEVYDMCAANGLTDVELQYNVWCELEKVDKPVTVKTPTGTKDVTLPFVEDFRRLKRIVKSLLLKQKRAA